MLGEPSLWMERALECGLKPLQGFPSCVHVWCGASRYHSSSGEKSSGASDVP